ncbi:MAG: DinB family protein [Deinococcaceae bacterium]
MNELSRVLVESFRRNGQVNDVLLGHLTPSDLGYSDQVGGMSIGQHLEHLVGFRKGWLAEVSPEYAKNLSYITLEGDERFWKTTLDLDQLRAAFREGDCAVLDAVLDAYASGQPFADVYTSDPAHFLQHTLVHDAHHRGQVLALLRQNGRTLEHMDEIERATWPIWRM